MVQRGVTANAGRPLRPRHTEMKDMKLFEDIVSEEVSDKLFRPWALVFCQLERKVEERESDTLRGRSFHVIRLQESESHTAEMSANRPQANCNLFHRNTLTNCD